MIGNNNKQLGFTLVEALVSLAVFAITAVLLTLLVMFIQTEQDIYAKQNLSNRLRFALDQIARDIQIGQIDYQAYVDNGYVLDPNGAVAVLFLKDSEGKEIIYDITGIGFGHYALLRNHQNLLPDGVYLTNLDFYLRPVISPWTAGSTENIQPSVLISLQGEALGAQRKVWSVNLQTTITAREYGR